MDLILSLITFCRFFFWGCNVFFFNTVWGKGVKWEITVLGYKRDKKFAWAIFLNSRSKNKGGVILQFCLKYQSHLSIRCNSFDAVFKWNRLVRFIKSRPEFKNCLWLTFFITSLLDLLFEFARKHSEISVWRKLTYLLRRTCIAVPLSSILIFVRW